MSEDTKKIKNPSRRNFLKSTGSAATIAGIALGGIGITSKNTGAACQQD
jgi:hypothetical protein